VHVGQHPRANLVTRPLLHHRHPKQLRLRYLTKCRLLLLRARVLAPAIILTLRHHHPPLVLLRLLANSPRMSHMQNRSSLTGHARQIEWLPVVIPPTRLAPKNQRDRDYENNLGPRMAGQIQSQETTPQKASVVIKVQYILISARKGKRRPCILCGQSYAVLVQMPQSVGRMC
jgi:hypothetical protein